MTAFPSFLFFRRGILNPRAYFLRHRIDKIEKKKKEPNVGRRHNRDGPDVKSMTRQLTQTHSVSHTHNTLDVTSRYHERSYREYISKSRGKIGIFIPTKIEPPAPSTKKKKMIQLSYRRQIPEAQAFFFYPSHLKRMFQKKNKKG